MTQNPESLQEFENDLVKADVYEMAIAESVMQLNHGEVMKIREVFVPAYGISINIKGVWEATAKRYEKNKKQGKFQYTGVLNKLGHIYISKQDCKVMQDYVLSKSCIEPIKTMILSQEIKA